MKHPTFIDHVHSFSDQQKPQWTPLRRSNAHIYEILWGISPKFDDPLGSLLKTAWFDLLDQPYGCPMLHRFFKRQDTRPARSHPKRWSSARSWRMQWVWRPVDQGAENQLGGKWHVKMYQCVRAHNHHACGYHNFCMFRRLCFRRD